MLPSKFKTCWAEFIAWRLESKSRGLIRLAHTDNERQAIALVAKLYREGCTDRAQWQKAFDDAHSAASSARMTAHYAGRCSGPAAEAHYFEYAAAAYATSAAEEAAAYMLHRKSVKRARAVLSSAVEAEATVALGRIKPTNKPATMLAAFKKAAAKRQSTKLAQLLKAAR